MKMLYGAACPIIVAIISIILAGQAVAVEIVALMNPPTLEVGKAVTLKWKIEYRGDERTKASYLYLKKRKNNGLIEIASYSDKTLPFGKKSLGEKADVTSITPFEVIVNFNKLDYNDEFYFVCVVMVVTTSFLRRQTKSTLSVVDVKGGPTICGNSIMKEEYVLPVGVSSIDVTLCGNPRPRLSHIFDGNTFGALGIEVDKTTRMYKYKIQMKNIEKNNCGQNITFEVDGFGDKVEKSSTIIVKYKPPMIKNFEYIKKIGQNCTTFKIGDKYNRKCPLKYEITIYDENKHIANLQHNPFRIDSLFYKICLQDFFNKGEFATITPIWKHHLFKQEQLGNPSEFIQVRRKNSNNGSNDGKKKTSKSLTFVIPLVLGIIIILMIAIIVLIYKYKQKERRSTTTQRSVGEELMINEPQETTKGVQSQPTIFTNFMSSNNQNINHRFTLN